VKRWESDDGRVVLWLGDCLDVIPRISNISAVVTDPPYGLEFMGKGWDHGVPTVGYWAEVLRVLKPGGHMLAFGGTRTYHRLTCAIEDAGFEIHDCLMWLYGSGFPKSLNVSKALAKQGEDQDTVDQWQGYGTALKPAWEPIILARKKPEGTIAKNVLAHSAGGLNIDGCRVGTDDVLVRPDISREDNTVLGKGLGSGVQEEPQGRWPANLVLDEEAGQMLDEQSGVLKDGVAVQRNGGGQKIGTGRAFHGSKGAVRDNVGYGGEGGASRFFYCSKASQAERTFNRSVENKHPTVKPIDLMRWLVRLVSSPTKGVILDPFMGSGSTGVAAVLEGAHFMGIERDEASFWTAVERIKHVGVLPREDAPQRPAELERAEGQMELF